MRPEEFVIFVTFSGFGDHKTGFIPIFAAVYADVLKLVDKPDLGSGASRRVGSSPPVRTNPKSNLRVFSFQDSRMLCMEILDSIIEFQIKAGLL